MAIRRVVVVAMPCEDVVEVGGILDIVHAVEQQASHSGAFDGGYAVKVVSPVETVCAWPGLRIVGFGSQETMRVAFRRALSVSPNGYRSRFTTAVFQGILEGEQR